MPSNKKLYSIAEAAAKLGMTRAGVHAAIRQKRLKAKHGTFEVERIVKTKMQGWVIDEADLRAFEVSEQHQDAGKKNEARLTAYHQT
jgi:hypothetical protein